MASLLQYLAELANDPAAQQAFGKDPEAALEKSGLADHDKAVLRTRNAGLIAATVGREAVAAMVYAPSVGAPAPAFVYGAGAPNAFVYGAGAPPNAFVYSVGAGAPPHPAMGAPFVYGAGAPAPFVYGAGAPAPFVYGAGAPAPFVYGAGAPAPFVYGAGAPAPFVYGAGAPFVYGCPHPYAAAPFVYASQPAPFVYAPAGPGTTEPPK